MLLTLLGQPAAAAPVTWNPADKGPNLTLSGGDLTVTAATGSYDQFVRATQSKTSGKWVFAAVMNTADYTEGVGLCNASQDLTDDFLPLANAIMAMRDESQWKYNGTTVGAKTQFWASATEVMIALDADNRLVWMSSDGGTTWRGSAVGSPSAGTNGQAIGFTGAIFPCVTTSDGRSWVGRFTDADIAGTIPSGFTAWGDAGAISASASQTLGLVTQTANASTGSAISASASQTLALPTQTATAVVTVAASASQTLGLVAQTANLQTAGGSISASASQALALPTQTATAGVTVAASASQTLDLVTVAETAAVLVGASATQGLQLVTQAATAAVVDGRSASADQTLALVTQTATGVVVPSREASASQTLPLLTAAATSTVRVAANGNQTLPLVTQAATGTAALGPISASATQMLSPPTQIVSILLWVTVPDATGSWTPVGDATGGWADTAGPSGTWIDAA